MPRTNVHTVKPKLYFKTFVDSLDKSAETKRMYVWSLKTYCKWLGIADPNQLITKDLLISGESANQLEDQIIDFINYMKNERKLLRYKTQPASKLNLGKQLPKEWCKHISESLLRFYSEHHVWNKGLSWPDEVKKHISEGT